MEIKSKVRKDKIHKKIDNKEIRRKKLKRRLEINDCNNEEVFDFFNYSTE